MAFASEEVNNFGGGGEEERFSTKASFFGFDESFYNPNYENPPVPLVVWPPVEKFKFLKDGNFTFSLNGEAGIGVYAANPECLQGVEAGAIVEWLKSFGISSAMKSRAADAQILIYIKNTICTRKESYEIQIRPNKIVILAADYGGLLYALNTLKQLIARLSSVADCDSAKVVSIPCLLISDAPYVLNRALRLSWRMQVCHAKVKPAGVIRSLASMRFNTLFLDFDLSDNFDHELLDIKNLCVSFGIRLVPVVTISSQGPWKDIIMQLNSKPLDDLALSVADPDLAEIIADELLGLSLKQVFWMGDVPPPENIMKIANVQVLGVDGSRHSELDEKPLAIVWPWVESVLKKVSDYVDPLLHIAMLPLGSERDFLSPDLLIKYYCSQFSAINYRGPSIKAVIESSVFSQFADAILTIISRPEEKIIGSYREALIQLFSFRLDETSFRGPSSAILIDSTNNLERTYWSLVSSEESKTFNSLNVGQNAVIYPGAEEAIQCYYYYRQILQRANFRSSTHKMMRNLNNQQQNLLASCSEQDELFTSIDMLALISRTVHLLRSSALAVESGSNNLGGMEVEAPSIAIVEPQNPTQKRGAVYDNVDMSRPYAPKIFPKSSDVTKMLIEVVQHNILFRNFKPEEHARIVEAFDCIVVKAGETVIRQGDAGEYFYIVESGLLEVYMESCGVHVRIGRTLVKADYFGELALMYNTPRAATVISVELSKLWRIDRHTYRTIVMRHNKETSDEFHGLISNVHILNKRLGDVLSPGEIRKVVSTLEVEEFEHDSVIIRQHQTGDYFYIISEGQVDVWQESVDSTTGQRQSLGTKVATLHRGDYFGEKALLADDVRQASCVAVGRVVCLSLSRDDFIAMLGNWQDLTGVRSPTESSVPKKQRQASVYDSNYHISICLDDLDRLNTLGVGAFGRVSIARHKESGQLYALKAQSKAGIISNGMQEMVLTEVKIMSLVNHPLIAKLHGTMQDRKSIYFLLELLPGGEFFNFLQKMGKLSEDKARFYAASVVLAYEELHRNRIAYRDLKPENMVMDARGYVKLVDFGLAKQVSCDATWTMCGTPDYLAPEIILNKGHNHAVDYWALGVLVFEMIHGWPPFFHEQPMRVYEKIILGKVNFPDSFSKPLEDIVSKFLVTNPSKRLGNMKGALGDVMKHKWFGSFDWHGLSSGTLLAPFVPDLTEFDTALATAKARHPSEVDGEEYEDSDWMPSL